jgi:hypothetical protein
MSDVKTPDSVLNQLLERMVAAKQLSIMDAETLNRQGRNGSGSPIQSEEDVLRWLGKEYDVAYTSLEDAGRIASFFPCFPPGCFEEGVTSVASGKWVR